ncbi:MAG TPA: response regulator [bacterium]
MRKPRAFIVDDDPQVRTVLARFFSLRGYEALACEGPGSVCPSSGGAKPMCAGGSPCSDLLVTDVDMPEENGLDFIERLATGRCRLDAGNRAVISGALDGDGAQRARRLGCTVFLKPFRLGDLSAWLADCEGRMDLRQPLATRRREPRLAVGRAVSYQLGPGLPLRQGTALNVSASGLCFRGNHPLAAGQTIYIHESHLPSGQESTVQWVNELDGGEFVAAVAAVGRPGSPRAERPDAMDAPQDVLGRQAPAGSARAWCA